MSDTDPDIALVMRAASGDEGLHYYVMQLIHGLSLDDVLAELKRLRKESAAARSEHGANSVSAAVGTPAVAVQGEVRGDVSVHDVAQSLLTGRFSRSALLEE